MTDVPGGVSNGTDGTNVADLANVTDVSDKTDDDVVADETDENDVPCVTGVCIYLCIGSIRWS